LRSCPCRGWCNDDLEAEQVSLCLGSNYVISFYDGERDPFEQARKRM